MKLGKLIDIACVIMCVGSVMMIADAFFNPLPTAEQAGLYLIFALLVFMLALFIKHLRIQHEILKQWELRNFHG